MKFSVMKNDSYSEAIKEIESTLEKLQKNDIPVDQLESTLVNAKNLIELCKKRLRNIQTEIEKAEEEIMD
ncbi:MAG: exodeoxyribonuclease VII small subunit [Saprospiraceae bacterium]|nr:exodeoxyribonuclease VII small subunit [Saprospiraceae bacterium]